MKRQLFILRHAKSAWDTDAPTDFERPLAKRGLRDAPKVGKWMVKNKLLPDHVVSSPAERARQTVMLVCEELGIKKKKIEWDPRIYGGGTQELLDVLADCPKKAKSVLVVGHNPGLEFLFHHLVKKDEVLQETPSEDSESWLIKTATFVQLDMPEDWSNLEPGCGRFVEMLSPSTLPE